MDTEARPTGSRILAAVLIPILLASVGAGTAAAQSTSGFSGSVVVAEDETVDDIEGVSGSVIVRGTVTGDVSGVSGTVHVTEGATVEGSIETAAGNVRIDGTVEGDVDAGSGHVEVSDTARIGDDLSVGAGYLSMNGAVDGDVRASAETIVLGPDADVGGEFRYDAREFAEDPNASVADGIVRDTDLGPEMNASGGLAPIPSWMTTVYGLVANLLLGAILLAVFPGFSREVATRVAGSPVVSGGAGLLTLIGVPIALVVLAVTIFGIPLAVAGALAFVLAIWLAVVYGQFAVGAWVLSLVGVHNRWLALVVGLVGFALLGAVPVLGPLLGFVAFLLGLGALTLGLWSARGGRRGSRERGRQTTLDERSGAGGFRE